MEIKMANVDSSSLSAIGYDEKSQTLRIQFSRGATYDYDDVPKAQFELLRDHPGSKGKFFAANIKDSYNFKKLEEDDSN